MSQNKSDGVFDERTSQNSLVPAYLGPREQSIQGKATGSRSG